MGVNWSHRREALSWLVFFFGPLVGLACAIIMPFAVAHPLAFKVLLVALPACFVAWAIMLVTRKRKRMKND